MREMGRTGDRVEEKGIARKWGGGDMADRQTSVKTGQRLEG